MAKFTQDGAVDLYHNDVKKLETTSAGIKIGAGDHPVDTDADDIVVMNTSGASGITISAQNNSVSSLRFGDSDLARSGMFYYNHNDNYLRIDTSGTPRMRIDSSGDVLIGQTSQTGYAFGQKLVVGDGDANDGITIQSGSTHQGNLAFNHSDGTTAHGRISYQHNSNYMQFFVNNSEKMRILTSGGITFNGDTAAANALDDYEEGTWTPVLQNVTTSSSAMYGIYTKIGNICHIHAKIAVTLASLPGSNWNISGLPFTSLDASDSNQRAIITIGGDCVNLGGLAIGKAHFRTNGTSLQGVYLNSGTTAYWTYNTMDSTSIELNIHGHYTTT